VTVTMCVNIRIKNHGGHGVFDTKIIFPSVKLRVLRGEKLLS